MSASYANVIGGRLRLKGSGPIRSSGAPISGGKRSAAAAGIGGGGGSGGGGAGTDGGGGGSGVSFSVAAAAPPAPVATAPPPAAEGGKTPGGESFAAVGGDATGGAEAGSDGRTPAERVYDEAQAKRQRAVAQKMAAKSYREKVADLNAALVKAPEHNDLFRISYGQS